MPFKDTQSKAILSFSTNAKIIELVEKTLVGGMSIINTSVGFDSNIFIKNNQQKLVYKIRNKFTNETEHKRVSTIILKMDENNQYGNVMTKPLTIGCIKKESYSLTVRELCLILNGLSHLDAIGHLFVVDIEFNAENATEKQLSQMKSILPCLKKTKYCLHVTDQFTNYLTQLELTITVHLITINVLLKHILR